MSNVAGKAYAMNVLTPMSAHKGWINHILFMYSRAFPAKLGGLLGLSIIHFARWVIIPKDKWPDFGQVRPSVSHDYVMFCSNFNGTWDQYIDAFSDGIPDGLDLLWYAAIGYPHSIPITPFKDYIRHNQIDTDYYYNATPGVAQRDIKASLRVRRAVLALQSLWRNGDVEAFAAAYRTQLIAVQRDLGSVGYAPVASTDTAAADCHREALLREKPQSQPQV